MNWLVAQTEISGLEDGDLEGCKRVLSKIVEGDRFTSRTFERFSRENLAAAMCLDHRQQEELGLWLWGEYRPFMEAQEAHLREVEPEIQVLHDWILEMVDYARNGVPWKDLPKVERKRFHHTYDQRTLREIRENTAYNPRSPRDVYEAWLREEGRDRSWMP